MGGGGGEGGVAGAGEAPAFGADGEEDEAAGFPGGITDVGVEGAEGGFDPGEGFFDGEDAAGEEIRLAHEGGDEPGAGVAVDFGGGAELLDAAVVEDGHAVGDGEGFFLVVGDVEGGEAGLAADAADFAAHFDAEAGVEVREGLVQEEAAGADDEGAGEGDALLLAAGELVDAAGAEAGHLDGGEGGFDALGNFGGGEAAFFEAEGDVAGDGLMGPEGVALEHHAKLAAVGRELGDVFFVEEDAAGVGLAEAGDGAEEGGFAAAGGAEEEEDFAGGDAKVEVVEGEGVAKALGEGEEGEGDHGGSGFWGRGVGLARAGLRWRGGNRPRPPTRPRSRIEGRVNEDE